MDLLTKMMEMQEFLNSNVIKKLGMRHYKITDEVNDPLHLHKREWVDKFASALLAEVCETREAATQNVKWWKNKTKDMDGLKEEIIDCFHFLMSMALASGMDAQEVYRRYVEKNKENLTRPDWDVNKEKR